MNPEKVLNLVLGIFVKVDEEKTRFFQSLQKEYARILTIGTNNNSSEAMAIRETTEMVFSFLEDIKYNSK